MTTKPNILDLLNREFPNPAEAPDKIPKDILEKLQEEMGWKSASPVAAQFGKWKKTKAKSLGKPVGGGEPLIKHVKTIDPETKMAKELTIFRRSGNTLWVR